MPDVSRSDSQRSDASQKPRVSFNRDVHVKRIVPRENARVSGAVSGEVSTGGQVVTSLVRKERLDNKSKRELEKEAAKVLHQVDRLDCVTNENSVSPEKFYTLPRKKPKEPDFNSLGRRTKRRIPPTPEPPRKPPRTFANDQKPSVFDVFKRKTLGRSVSDASALKKRTSGSPEGTHTGTKKEKKQLSPIIELVPREDYFEGVEDKENRDGNVVVKKKKKKKESVTEQLKKFIDEVDEELYKETGVRVKRVEPERPIPIIIDVDKAQDVSTPNKKKRFKNVLGKKLKSIARKEKKRKPKPNEAANKLGIDVAPEEKHLAPKIKQAIADLNKNSCGPKMIHSSQKPVEKLPLTKGRTVDPLVKYLSTDNCSPPPPLNKTNILITPHGSVQHNNNQPFSYTRGVSPEKPHSPVIYAQVVCGAPGKHTVHAAFNNGRRHPHSDSDEGLGGEDTPFAKKIGSYDDVDHVVKYEEESPITPKFRNPSYVNGYSNGYLDSSNRGRADGMDSKRRESLTEPHEPRQTNGRSDLSARRDLLESRINRRLNDNTIRTSPEYLKGSAAASPTSPTSGYYRSGSTSPKRYHIGAKNGYHHQYDSEPKSFDSQASDYRSSPDYNARTTIYKYKSTPEISLHHHHHHHHQDHHSYSLRREKADGRVVASGYSEEGERKEKFVDSGIENDFRRDSSGEHFQTRSRPVRYSNESEDEGFASSLLIASERQHTEDSHRRNFDKKDEKRDRIEETGEYRQRFRSSDYMPRERSIDDGSHYDPRIDKDGDRTLKRVVDKKPPKPEKKSGLDKVKSLFTRDSKKKKEKQQAQGMVREESLRARYVEYKGREMVESKYKKKDYNNDYQANYDYSPRKRYQSPSPSPTRQNSTKTPVQRNGKLPSENGGWFKSLDRLSRKKNKKDDKDAFTCSGTEEDASKPTPTKNLRFFGDTDIESNDSSRHQKPPVLRHRSQSTRDLHKETRTRSPEPLGARKTGHKSLTNITEQIDARESRSLKPPMSPTHRVPRDTSRQERSRRRKNEVSSVESSTEGDSSQQSQRSIVYLHAATVGDIPGPGYLRNGRRAASREELASNGSSRIQPQVKTLSRSFSVLAPWRPRHPREGVDLDYSQYPKKNGKYEQRTSKVASSRKDSSSTLKKKAQETRKNQSSTTSASSSTTLNRRSKSKENLSAASSQTLRRSREELSRGSNSTLYKKKERLPRENSRYSSRIADKDESRKMSSKSLSVESLRRARGGGGDEGRDVSRSVSMPRDPEKSAGWFRMTRKKTSSSAQRL